MNNGGLCERYTRGGKEGTGQLVVSRDVLDLLDHIHQPPHHRRDSPVTQNPAQGVQEMKRRGQRQGGQTERENQSGEEWEKDFSVR